MQKDELITGIIKMILMALIVIAIACYTLTKSETEPPVEKQQADKWNK